MLSIPRQTFIHTETVWDVYLCLYTTKTFKKKFDENHWDQKTIPKYWIENTAIVSAYMGRHQWYSS